MTPIRPILAATVLVVLTLGGGVLDARAEFISGQQLAARCREENRLSLYFCIGYLTGAYDSLKGTESVRIVPFSTALNAKQIKVDICPPKTLDANLLRSTYVAWADANPSGLQQPAPIALRRAIQASWKCHQDS